MLKKQWITAAFLVMASFSLSMYGCSDDDPAGPGTGGGGGGGGAGTKMAAGVYNLTLSQWTCGMMDTTVTPLEQVECSDFTFDELFELDCPVIITNNSFTVDCTSMEVNGLCTYREHVQVTGTKVGNTWTITGTITISNESPADCADDPGCINVLVTFEMVSGPPTACTYADVNTIAATIVGGPLAGSTDFETFGAGSGSGGIFAWDFFGVAGSSFVSAQHQDASTVNLANITVTLAEIDANNLPVTFGLTVVGGPLAPSALATGSVVYFDQTTAGDVFTSIGGSGSITINEVTDTYIAGTFTSLSIDGKLIPAGGGKPTPATRSLSGGFHVRAFGDLMGTGGLAGRLLSRQSKPNRN